MNDAAKKIATRCFGEFELVSPKGPLLRNDNVIPLRPKSLSVLWRLLKSANSAVSKEELIEAAWPDVTVSEGNLAVCIREIRKTLAKETGFAHLKTIHRFGSLFQIKAGNPLVGRDAHLALLDPALAQTRLSKGTLVFVGGQAGFGKSTLLQTWADGFEGDDQIRTAFGRSAPNGLPEAYGLFMDILVHLGSGEAGSSLRTKLPIFAPSWCPLVPALVDKGGIPHLSSTDASTGRMQRELVELLIAIAVQNPLVLILEDIQWADPSSIDLIGRLAGAASNKRILIVASARSDIGAVTANKFEQTISHLLVREQCVECNLAALDEQDIHALALKRLGTLDADLIADVLNERTGGHPLFVDIILRHLVELSAENRLQELKTAIPNVLTRFVQLRLAERSEEERACLTVASVAGDTFAVAELEQTLDFMPDQLNEIFECLARDGTILHSEGAERWPDGTLTQRHGFRHGLIADAIRRDLLGIRSAQIHLAIAMRLETAFGEGSPEISHKLAFHFEQGLDFPKAVGALVVAAERDSARHAHREAQALLQRGLVLIEKITEPTVAAALGLQLHLALGSVQISLHGYAATVVESTFAKARALCETPDLIEERVPVLRGLAGFHIIRSDYKTAANLGRQISNSKRPNVQVCTIEGAMISGIAAFFAGNFTDAETLLKQSTNAFDPELHMSLAAQHGLDPFAFAKSIQAVVSWLRGLDDHALKLETDVQTYLGSLDHPFSVAQCHAMLAFLQQIRGDIAQTKHHSNKARDLAEKFGFPYLIASERAREGWLLVQARGFDAGIVAIEDGMALYQDTGAIGGISAINATLGEAYFANGAIDKAGVVINQAIQSAEMNGEFFYMPELLRLRGLIKVRTDEDGKHDLCQAIALADQQGAVAWAVKARGTLSEIAG
ncbi:MAG: AAA family ATPase [Paracoccaceae bacterium]